MNRPNKLGLFYHDRLVGTMALYRNRLAAFFLVCSQTACRTDGAVAGEHATVVNGNGVNPGMEDVLAVAGKIGLNVAKARKTASNIGE